MCRTKIVFICNLHPTYEVMIQRHTSNPHSVNMMFTLPSSSSLTERCEFWGWSTLRPSDNLEILRELGDWDRNQTDRSATKARWAFFITLSPLYTKKAPIMLGFLYIFPIFVDTNNWHFIQLHVFISCFFCMNISDPKWCHVSPWENKMFLAKLTSLAGEAPILPVRFIKPLSCLFRKSRQSLKSSFSTISCLWRSS